MNQLVTIDDVVVRVDAHGRYCLNDLDMLAYLQERNAVLIGRGLDYDQRKPIIKQYAMDKRLALALAAEKAVAHA